MGRPVTEDDPLPAEDRYTLLTKKHNLPTFDNYEDCISTKELKELMDNKTPYTLIDLREQEEIELLRDYPIPTSVSMPVKPLTVTLEEIDVEQESEPNDFFKYVSHCALLHRYSSSS